MKQQGEYTSFSVDIQDSFDNMDCCQGVEVLLQLSVDDQVVYQSASVNAMGVEMEVHCATHSEDVDPDTYPAPPDGWVCFHCGQRFQKFGYAQDHFGPRPESVPACQMDYKHGLMELRKLEEKVAELEGR